MNQPSPHALILARLRRKLIAARARGAEGAYERYEELLRRFVAVFPQAAAELEAAQASDQEPPAAAAARGKQPM